MWKNWNNIGSSPALTTKEYAKRDLIRMYSSALLRTTEVTAKVNFTEVIG